MKVEKLKELVKNFLTSCKTEKYLAANTIYSYESDLNEFIDFMEKDKLNIKNLKTSELAKFFQKIASNNLSTASHLRKISSIGQFMSFLCELDIIKKNPISEIDRPKKGLRLPDFLSESDINKLISASDANDKFGIRNKCIIELLYSSGMRVSELANLKIVDTTIQKIETKMITIMGKGRKERLVPLNDKAILALKEYLSVRDQFKTNDSGKIYLFCSRSKSGKLTREQIGIMLKQVAIKSGVSPDKVHPHALRHSFATELCRKKVNLRIIQELLGHSDISTTQIYLDVADQEMIDFLSDNHPMAAKSSPDQTNTKS